MGMTGLQTVLDNIRPSFEYNVLSVEKFLSGTGLDMGCGNCPLLRDDCLHVDQAPQPIAVEQVGPALVIQANAIMFDPGRKVDYVFSSHMVEDLPSRQAIIDCLNGWTKLLKPGGYIVLLLPDMQNRRYPTVADGGNPSHRVDVGVQFVHDIKVDLPSLELAQLDTIPHDRSCTLDVVFRNKINDSVHSTM